MNVSQDDAAVVARVEEALRVVIDPELGLNIVDLGLVYEISVDAAGLVKVRMTTTTRGCPATDYLLEGASNAVSRVSEVPAVEVSLTYDPPWTPQEMSSEAKHHFGIDEESSP